MARLTWWHDEHEKELDEHTRTAVIPVIKTIQAKGVSQYGLSAKDSPEIERLETALTPEQLASRWIVSSDPEEHVEKISKYIELGFIHLVFHAPGPDQENFLRLYAEQVLPRLRARYGGLEVSKATRQKELEVENAKLKKLLAEAALKNRQRRTADRLSIARLV